MKGRVGDVDFVRLPDTPLSFPLRAMVNPEELGNRPFEEMLSDEYYDPPTGKVRMPVNVWLLRSAGKLILIDTGTGDIPRKGMEDSADEWPVTRSPLMENLAAAGVASEDIDLVLCTHLHLDHVGGHTHLADGAFVPTFPNASYVISRADYEHAATEAADERTPILFRNIFDESVQPLIEAGAALLIDGPHRVDTDITMVPAPGHSPGHMRIEIRSAGDLAIHCGDIVHLPYEIPEPEIPCANSDHDPTKAVRTRVRLLEDCADQGALLVTVHLHDPGVGRISRNGHGFCYDPGWTD